MFPASTAVGVEDSKFVNPSQWPSHDWRSPGFVAIVDGKMYDPDCWPLVSIGANVPNMMYRESIIENLEWMRKNRVRWIRVFVTGHREQINLTTDLAEQRIRELTTLIEAYNAAVPRAEAIYLMFTLSDYYGQGVPGDRYLRDNPEGCEFMVLPAPWFRRGVPYFDFQPECGDDRVIGVPNYEINFKPWVLRIARAVSESPAILGWQIGNELKARKSPRNDAEKAYDWYLDFMNDMVDTIRSVDRNHLIITPSQYLAEVADFPYRPDGNSYEPWLRETYLKELHRTMMSCGANCWNIWNLTFYDFTPYSLDDAMMLGKGRVASLATEYGFTLGNAYENQVRFGGDRVAALRNGIERSWQDINGAWRRSYWGLGEAISALDLVGAAAWGSPNPDPNTDPGSDLDRRRGISHAPEGLALWNQWTYVANDLEYANGRAGVSSACRRFNSSGKPLLGPPPERPPALPSLISKPQAPPSPPIDMIAVVKGISTDALDPNLVVKGKQGELTIRMPRTQAVKTFNIGDVVRVRGWPMGDDVMWATSLEQAPGRRP